MIISKTQLDLIRRSSDEILLNKYDYYNSMPVRTLTALLNLKAIKQELDRRNLLAVFPKAEPVFPSKDFLMLLL